MNCLEHVVKFLVPPLMLFPRNTSLAKTEDLAAFHRRWLNGGQADTDPDLTDEDFTGYLQGVADALAPLGANLVIDDEIFVVDDKEVKSFLDWRRECVPHLYDGEDTEILSRDEIDADLSA